MLAYILAIAVGFGSFALYLTAFFFPEVHRKDDFLWSGVGLFYALVLWVCAGRITGGVLLGQVAGVSLLAWFAWQSLILRRAIAHPEAQTEILDFSLTDWLSGKLGKVFSRPPKPKTQASIPQTQPEEKTEIIPTPTETAVAEEKTEVETIPSPTETVVKEEEFNWEDEETETIATFPETLVKEEQEEAEITPSSTETLVTAEEIETTPTLTETVVTAEQFDWEEGETKTITTPSETLATEEKKPKTITSAKKKKGFSLTNILAKITSPFRKSKPQEKNSELKAETKQETESIPTSKLLELIDTPVDSEEENLEEVAFNLAELDADAESISQGQETETIESISLEATNNEQNETIAAPISQEQEIEIVESISLEKDEQNETISVPLAEEQEIEILESISLEDTEKELESEAITASTSENQEIDEDEIITVEQISETTKINSEDTEENQLNKLFDEIMTETTETEKKQDSSN